MQVLVKLFIVSLMCRTGGTHQFYYISYYVISEHYEI